ncbi:hypothetical protein AB6A40_010298 [Gnathostoma spinigerum]|uniref:Uncharacterized protein n=1 Tax=Gnathostoma spinigerum TaxID=75299 RepID=A0ABD6EZF8_9BILA
MYHVFIYSGIFVDRTKLYEETMKVSLALAVVIGLLFLQLTLHAGLAVPIAVCCFIFGVLGLATYPVGLEMSTECTFPVPETISTGLIVISGQIQSSVYLGLMKYFAKPLQPDYMDIQVCTTGEKSFASLPKDNTNCVIIFSGIATSLVLILIILFRPKYKRLMAEQNGTAKAKALLANEEKTGVINDKRVKVYLSKECSAAQPLTHGIVNSTG